MIMASTGQRSFHESAAMAPPAVKAEQAAAIKSTWPGVYSRYPDEAPIGPWLGVSS